MALPNAVKDKAGQAMSTACGDGLAWTCPPGGEEVNADSTAAVVVERGSVLVYRMFDIAESIDLAAIEQIAQTGLGTSRLRIARPGGQALIIKNAPVSLFVGEQEIVVADVPHRCSVHARVWDYGVISFQFRLPLAGVPWLRLIALAAALEVSTAFEEAARQRLDEIRSMIAPAVRGPHLWAGAEDYIIYFIEELRGVEDAADLLDRADVAALLLGEAAQPLSKRTRHAVTETVHQYWSHDLAVIDWNSAVVVEPSGARDVADVIEFAVTHLIELRYYDDLLDEKLGNLYGAISQSQRTLFRTNYARLSREASALFMDITEFIEQVENSLKVIGDFYLATIFRGSVRRLRLSEWEESVTRKLQLLARVSELLSAQSTAYRSYLLEWIVILLIAFEIVWAITGRGH